MRYFVLGDNGQKYGPADVPTLEAWATEGRLLAATQLEDETTGERKSAAELLPSRFQSVTPPPAAAPQMPAYVAPPVDESATNRQGYIGIGLAVLSVVLSFTISIGGLLAWSYGMRSSWTIKDSKPGLAWTGIILNGIAALIWLAVLIINRMPDNP